MKLYLKVMFLVIVLSTTIFPAVIFDQPFNFFFKPRPVATNEFSTDPNSPRLVNPTILDSLKSNIYWEFKPIVQVPALKVNKSIRTNATLDVVAFMSTGGGVTY